MKTVSFLGDFNCGILLVNLLSSPQSCKIWQFYVMRVLHRLVLISCDSIRICSHGRYKINRALILSSSRMVLETHLATVRSLCY